MTTFLVHFYRGMELLTHGELLLTKGARPSEVQSEDPKEEEVKPSEESTATTSQDLLSLGRRQPSSERNEISEKEDMLEPKTSEEYAKELTPSEEILD